MKKSRVLTVLILVLILVCVFCACDNEKWESGFINFEEPDEIYCNNYASSLIYEPVTDKAVIKQFIDMMNSCKVLKLSEKERKQVREQYKNWDFMKVGDNEFAIIRNGYYMPNVPYGTAGFEAIQSAAIYKLNGFDAEVYRKVWKAAERTD